MFKLMKKIYKEEIEEPFVVGKTYITKMQTGEKFTITKIGKTQVYGIYENHPNLGECPLKSERLIQHKYFTGVETEVIVCPNCKHEFKN